MKEEETDKLFFGVGLSNVEDVLETDAEYVENLLPIFFKFILLCE